MGVQQVLDLCEQLGAHGIGCWLMGGWGVDALAGRTTRPHKDLDLLVGVSDLCVYADLVRANGFDRLLVWAESTPLERDGRTFDTAFVDQHRDGREIDVHVIDIDDDGTVVPLHGDPWPLPPGALSGEGALAGRAVRCVSLAAQLAMHSTYDLPDKHREDVRLLRDLVLTD